MNPLSFPPAPLSYVPESCQHSSPGTLGNADCSLAQAFGCLKSLSTFWWFPGHCLMFRGEGHGLYGYKESLHSGGPRSWLLLADFPRSCWGGHLRRSWYPRKQRGRKQPRPTPATMKPTLSLDFQSLGLTNPLCCLCLVTSLSRSSRCKTSPNSQQPFSIKEKSKMEWSQTSKGCESWEKFDCD